MVEATEGGNIERVPQPTSEADWQRLIDSAKSKARTVFIDGLGQMEIHSVDMQSPVTREDRDAYYELMGDDGGIL